MRIKPVVASVVGPTTETHWGQVLMTPSAYGVIEVTDTEGIARQQGVHILSELHKAFSCGISSLENLRILAHQVHKDGVRTVLLFIPVGTIVYIVLCGEGIVYVKRGNVLSELVNQETAISGEAREGDIFLFASAEFKEVLTRVEIGNLFDHLTPSEVAEKITLVLHEKSKGAGSAAFIYQVASFTESEPQEPSVEEPACAGSIEEPQESSRQKIRRFVPLQLFELARKMKLRHRYPELREHPKKRVAFLAVMLGCMFLLSVGVGVIKQARASKNQKVVSALLEAQHALDEGAALLDLNPPKGRERLTQAKITLEPFLTSVPVRSEQGRQIATLNKKITEYLTQSLHSTKVTLELFYDVNLIKRGSTASALALSEGTLVMIDTSLGTVYELDISSKKAQILAGGETLKGVTSVGIHGEKVYVLGDTGVYQIKRVNDMQPLVIVKKDIQWGNIAKLVMFGGNIYLLDIQNNRIWKYVATEKGFSDIREYLNPDTLPDFSAATSMAIDGSVWISTKTGKIIRFTQGKENTYIPKGLDVEFGMRLLVYTDDTVNNVYVLDSEHKRIVVLDKEGMYVAQYQWDEAMSISDMLVSESQKKILLLSSGKLYSIELK